MAGEIGEGTMAGGIGERSRMHPSLETWQRRRHNTITWHLLTLPNLRHLVTVACLSILQPYLLYCKSQLTPRLE